MGLYVCAIHKVQHSWVEMISEGGRVLAWIVLIKTDLFKLFLIWFKYCLQKIRKS